MTVRTKLALLAALSLAASLSIAAADTIELQDGRNLSGTVSRQGNQATIKTDDGQTITAAWTDIVRVSLSGPADSPAAPGRASPDAAKSEWTRIAAQIKTTPDLPKIIDLHQNFLAKYPDSPVAQQVKESLTVYQQLADANAVRFHGKWMPPDQVDVIQKQWTDAAQPAQIAYAAGKFKEALDAAKAVLAKDNQNPDALTLAGLAAYRANALGVARKYFMDLAQSDPASGLAWNNLAVVCNQQKQINESLADYTKALMIMPANPVLLDNIIEATSAFKKSGADTKGDSFRALATAFAPAEAAREAEMAKRGLYRFGSTWATKDQWATAAANAKLIHAQMEPFDAKFKTSKDAQAEVEAKITQATADDETAANILHDAFEQTHSNQANAFSLAGDNAGLAGLVAQFNTAQKNWELADQHRVTLLVQEKDLLTDRYKLVAEVEKLKKQLGNAESPVTGEQQVIELSDQKNPRLLADNYVPRPLPTEALPVVPSDRHSSSTVSTPEPGDGSKPQGDVLVEYRSMVLQIIPGGTITKNGHPMKVNGFIMPGASEAYYFEIPQGDPGRLLLFDFGNGAGGPFPGNEIEFVGLRQLHKANEGWPVRSRTVGVTVGHTPTGALFVKPLPGQGDPRGNPIWPQFPQESVEDAK